MSEIILPIHLTVLAVTAFFIYKSDHLGFLWMTGKIGKLDNSLISKYHRRVFVGLIMMILTGFIMFWPMREFLLTRTQFYIKMGFVVALLMNSVVIGHLKNYSVKYAFKDLTSKQKIKLFISGGVSTVSWVMAAVSAFFLIPD